MALANRKRCRARRLGLRRRAVKQVSAAENLPVATKKSGEKSAANPLFKRSYDSQLAFMARTRNGKFGYLPRLRKRRRYDTAPSDTPLWGRRNSLNPDFRFQRDHYGVGEASPDVASLMLLIVSGGNATPSGLGSIKMEEMQHLYGIGFMLAFPFAEIRAPSASTF
jgi:hypothetical protein